MTKDAVLAVALHTSGALYAVGLAATALAAAYSGKALALVGGYDTEWAGTRRVRPLQWVPLLALAVVSAVLGVQALPPVADAYRHLLGAAGETSTTWWELAVSAAVAAAAVAAAWALARLRGSKTRSSWLT